MILQNSKSKLICKGLWIGVLDTLASAFRNKTGRIRDAAHLCSCAWLFITLVSTGSVVTAQSIHFIHWARIFKYFYPIICISVQKIKKMLIWYLFWQLRLWRMFFLFSYRSYGTEKTASYRKVIQVWIYFQNLYKQKKSLAVELE